MILVCTIPVFAMIEGLLWSFIAEQLSQKSDMAVAVGLVVLSLSLLVHHYIIRFLISKFHNK